MSKQTEVNSRHYVFIVKSAACLFGLLLASFILVPQASMQDEGVKTTNANVPVIVNNNTAGGANMRMMSNYQPTPEPPKSIVRGRVIYADTGRAVRRAGLMLLEAKGLDSGGKENSGLTGEQGEFEIRNVSEGKYFMSVSAPGVLTPFGLLSNFVKSPTKDSSAMTDVAKNFQEIVVSGGSDADVTIVVKRGAVITGKITYADGEAAIGVRVEILRKKAGQYNAVVTSLGDVMGAMFGGAAGAMKTDDRGVFRIAGLPAGDYIARVVENVSHTAKASGRDEDFTAIGGFNPNSMVATYYPNTIDLKKAEVIKIEIGREQSEVNITIPERKLHNLSGTVINRATREPVKNVKVSIKSQDDVKTFFSDSPDFGSKNDTDEQGRWNFKELPAGKYILTVQPPDDNEMPDMKNPPKVKTPKLFGLQKEIVVGEKDISDDIAELVYGASVSGTISSENGQNLPALVYVYISEVDGTANENASVGDADGDDGSPEKAAPKKSGAFKIEGLPTGKFHFRVSVPPSADGTGKEEFYVKSILYAGRDITDGALETKEGEEVKGVQIVVSKDVGKIKGKVFGADKSPAAGARMEFVSTDKRKWNDFTETRSITTNDSGEFEISGAPGEYFIFFVRDEDFRITEDDSKEDAGKSIFEIERARLDKKTKNAQKVKIKAGEIEKITLTLPENQ